MKINSNLIQVNSNIIQVNSNKKYSFLPKLVKNRLYPPNIWVHISPIPGDTFSAKKINNNKKKKKKKKNIANFCQNR